MRQVCPGRTRAVPSEPASRRARISCSTTAGPSTKLVSISYAALHIRYCGTSLTRDFYRLGGCECQDLPEELIMPFAAEAPSLAHRPHAPPASSVPGPGHTTVPTPPFGPAPLSPWRSCARQCWIADPRSTEGAGTTTAGANNISGPPRTYRILSTPNCSHTL